MTQIRFRTRWRAERDHWTTDGPKITSPESLRTIQDELENKGPIIVAHWFYRGSSAPDRFIFDEYETFVEYLEKQAVAGDIIDVWSFYDLCKDDNTIASGKCPAEDGCVPEHGAY
jgi:hypothetical protein